VDVAAVAGSSQNPITTTYLVVAIDAAGNASTPTELTVSVRK
jgi:hypothetical protein